jgi:hypothetical protein
LHLKNTEQFLRSFGPRTWGEIDTQRRVVLIFATASTEALAPGLDMASDNTPFIVTLVIGVLGWTLSHIADRIEQSPAIKYSLTQETVGPNSWVNLDIKNITENKKFKNLTIVLAAPDKSSFKDAQIVPRPPAFEGDAPWRLAGRTAQFTIPAIQPGWEFHIMGEYNGTGKAVVRFISDDSESVVRAIEPSIETWLAEYESDILYGLVIVWLLVLTGHLLFRYRAKVPTMDT